MRRVVIVIAIVALLLAATAYMARKPLTMRAMTRVVATNFAEDWVAELPDGLYVALCGAGSPLPDPERSGPCAAVIAGDRLFIVDSGSGSSRILSRMRVPQGRIEAVLLTHFHSDHIDGLGELLLQRWANGGASEPTPIWGPEGVEQVVDGFNLAYEADHRYRVAHHGEAVMNPAGAGAVAVSFPAPASGEAVVLLDEGGLRITAFDVDHPPIEPAVGYRFDYAGRSVVLSGDTNKSANLARFAQGVDLLVHEALAPQLVAVLTEEADAAGRTRIAKITADILDYHASPVEAAQIAAETGAGHLLFYHIVPPLPLAPLEEIFLEGTAGAYDGPITVGRDGTFVRLPAGSSEIVVEQLL